MKKIGFTGTQQGMTDLQQSEFERVLLKLNPIDFHHGDCVGADAQASTVAELRGIYIVLHPPINRGKRAFMPSNEQRKPKEYLTRNHDIVDECEHLIACPGETTEQLKSGTWSTIRYARRVQKPITIVYPDGKVYTENQTSCLSGCHTQTLRGTRC